MKKATLGIGLQSEREDWFTSSSVAEGIPREWVEEVSRWAFREGCRRLQGGGWETPRQLSFSMTAHVNVTRLMDESVDMETHFHPAIARQIVEHLFSECMMLIFKKHP